MGESTAALVAVSAALAGGDRDRLDAALQDASRLAEPLEVEEALLQAYLFLGYPAALRGLAAWRRVSGRAAPAPRRDEAEWEARGASTCATVYGGQYERLRGNVARLHADVERWMIMEGYGKVLGRPGLELKRRELCIIALLAPQDAAPQLYSHLRGALNAGATEQEVSAAVDLILPWLAAERAAVLLEQWAAVRERRPVNSS